MAHSDTISMYDDRSITDIKATLNWNNTHENKEKILFVLCDHIDHLEKKIKILEEKLDKVHHDLYD